MSLFDNLGGQQPAQQQINPQQMMHDLKANPASFLQQMGLSIPSGMTDPQQIVQHIMQSGQLKPGVAQQIMRFMPRR